MIKIEDREFKLADISQLYPSAMIKTGYEDELTPISLEWIDSQKDNPDVIVVKYAIFVHLKDKSVSSFFYKSKEELDRALEKLSSQF